MESQNGIIYISINLLNEKRYVGQTYRNVEKRIREHINNKTHFEKALNKYKFENFYIIKIQYPRNELNQWETYYINFFNTFDSPLGYNHTTGGEVYEVSEATKNKMSQNHANYDGENHPRFGTHHSEESNTKNSISHSGKNHPMFGKHRSEESNRKSRIAQLGEKSYWFGKHQSKETIEKKTKGWKERYENGEIHFADTKGDKNGNVKLKNEEVKRIKLLLQENKLNQNEIAKMFNISSSQIWRIKHGKLWKDVEIIQGEK